MDKKELVNEAIKARENAFVPYSKFKVGASLLTKDGRIFIGSNMESASYGLTLCAERNCIFGAYARGVRKNDIVAFAVVADTNGPVSPCGACRQVIAEYINKDVPIYLANLKGDIIEYKSGELIPYFFDGSEL